MEGEKELHEVVLLSPHTCGGLHVHTPTVIKKIKVFFKIQLSNKKGTKEPPLPNRYHGK